MVSFFCECLFSSAKIIIYLNRPRETRRCFSFVAKSPPFEAKGRVWGAIGILSLVHQCLLQSGNNYHQVRRMFNSRLCLEIGSEQSKINHSHSTPGSGYFYINHQFLTLRFQILLTSSKFKDCNSDSFGKRQHSLCHFHRILTCHFLIQ